jgi:hypothetical protein
MPRAARSQFMVKNAASRRWNKLLVTDLIVPKRDVLDVTKAPKRSRYKTTKNYKRAVIRWERSNDSSLGMKFMYVPETGMVLRDAQRARVPLDFKVKCGRDSYKFSAFVRRIRLLKAGMDQAVFCRMSLVVNGQIEI